MRIIFSARGALTFLVQEYKVITEEYKVIMEEYMVIMVKFILFQIMKFTMFF